VNLKAIHELQDVNRVASPQYLPPSELLEYARLQGGPAGRPLFYTVIGSSDYMGAKTILFSPAPNADTVFDFYYEKWPRPIKLQNYSLGLITGSQGGFTISGASGAAWADRVEGAIIRIGDSPAQPSGLFGSNPFLMERTVMEWTNSTSLEVDSALTEAVDSVGYCISDPLDIDVPVMWEALKCCAAMLLPKHPARESRWYKGELEVAYAAALSQAAGNDQAVNHRRIAGGAHGIHSYTVTPGATFSTG
jgi:hypothetical protein